jgi:hypothetical protein
MRLVGWLASALGLLGILFGNGLASVVWVLKLNVQSRIRDLVAVPDGGLDIATTLAETVADGLTQMSAQAGDVQGAADGLVAAPDGDAAAAAAAGLAAAIDVFVTGPYASFRALYQRLRERAIAVGDAVGRLGTSVPIANVPPALVERLQAIDARMIEIDASVTYLSQLGPEGLSEPGVAATVSERSAQAQERLASVSELVAGIEGWIGDARGRIDERERRFSRWLSVGTAAASIAGLLLAGLNVLLFQQGRRWSSRR